MTTLNTDDDLAWDVVVVGGGPSGVAAAVAAAETQARVLLVERSSTLGGMGTIGKVPAWCPFSDKKQVINRGFAAKVLAASKASTPHISPEQIDWVPINAEALKVIYDEFVTKAGVTVRFDTLLIDVSRDDSGGIASIICADKSGLRSITSRVFIDATGDADLVARSGVDLHKGDNDGGELMPATLCFTLANVHGFPQRLPELKNMAQDNDEPIIRKIRNDKRFGAIPDERICMCWSGPGCVSFNAGHVFHVDNTDPESVTRGIMEGRALAAVYREALAAYLPEIFADSHLVSTGSHLGIRETRRIIADYELTLGDYLNRRSFPDEICRNAYFIDLDLMADELDDGDNWEQRVHERGHKYHPGESHGIPYRCLCPKDLRNVLVAGRCIGTDRAVNGSVRVMPVCLNTGEAAGVAASMVNEAGNIHDVDVRLLRQNLLDRGAYLP